VVVAGAAVAVAVADDGTVAGAGSGIAAVGADEGGVEPSVVAVAVAIAAVAIAASGRGAFAVLRAGPASPGADLNPRLRVRHRDACRSRGG